MTTAWGGRRSDDDSPDPEDLYFYMLAIAAGSFAGWIDVKLDDLLVTALLVLASCMLLGVLRPRRAWRWVAVVGIFVPVADLFAYILLTQKPTRAQVYESLLVFLPGIAGSYGGSMMRGVIDNLMAGN
jgi:ABC-type multidrug transport system permease subunit